jgi:hypothetical protein
MTKFPTKAFKLESFCLVVNALNKLVGGIVADAGNTSYLTYHFKCDCSTFAGFQANKINFRSIYLEDCKGLVLSFNPAYFGLNSLSESNLSLNELTSFFTIILVFIFGF